MGKNGGTVHEEIFGQKVIHKKKVVYLSMKKRTVMKDHFDEFNKLIIDLENVNIVRENEDKALILLNSLSDSYEHFVGTLLYERRTLTLKDVKNRTDGKDQTLEYVLVAKAKLEKKVKADKKNNNQKYKADKEKKKRICYLCQKKEHYIKDCFEKQKLEKLQNESNRKIAIMSKDKGDSEDVDVLIAAERKTSGE